MRALSRRHSPDGAWRQVMDFHNSPLMRDLKILENRMGLDPEVVDSGALRSSNDTISIRWDHADDPWLDYDADLQRMASMEAHAPWQRDRPFWHILDQADHFTDAQLISLWEDAKYAHGMVKDTNRMVRLGMASPTTHEEDFKVWVDALATRGRAPEDLGVIDGTH